MIRESEIRLGIFISGGGSTMETIVKASQEGGMLFGRINPVVVIASKPEIRGIERAKNLDIPVVVVRRKEFDSSLAFGDAILQVLDDYHVDVVNQNGWLPLTPENVVEHPDYKGNIYNQHPGPLDPEHAGENGVLYHFGGKGMHGLAVHAAVLEFQSRARRIFPTEATIHHVTSHVDEGTVVYRQRVSVVPGDTAETLAARVLPFEHTGQIFFLKNLHDGTVSPPRREAPLIQPHEVAFLQESVQTARELYPNG